MRATEIMGMPQNTRTRNLKLSTMGTTPRYIEWISPEEMHSATLAWLSELKFIKDEQRFLNSLVKSYTEQLIDHKIYDRSKQLVGNILDAEKELVGLYENAARHSARVGDQDSRLFFEALLAEEQHHAQSLEQWLQQLQQDHDTVPASKVTIKGDQ